MASYCLYCRQSANCSFHNRFDKNIDKYSGKFRFSAFNCIYMFENGSRTCLGFGSGHYHFILDGKKGMDKDYNESMDCDDAFGSCNIIYTFGSDFPQFRKYSFIHFVFDNVSSSYGKFISRNKTYQTGI